MHKNDDLQDATTGLIEKENKIIYDDEIFSMCKVTFKGIGGIKDVINCILDDLNKAFDISCFCHN